MKYCSKEEEALSRSFKEDRLPIAKTPRTAGYGVCRKRSKDYSSERQAPRGDRLSRALLQLSHQGKEVAMKRLQYFYEGTILKTKAKCKSENVSYLQCKPFTMPLTRITEMFMDTYRIGIILIYNAGQKLYKNDSLINTNEKITV